eukprot:gb/GFBE01043774.1/.p1 GENE.gb/GFBE01043774.1/~~gb/GFBE01043774.1/.p1  ORF type:complete len:290 (+),score=37.87 gb/GFBE01043774.1/:1-870(+)
MAMQNTFLIAAGGMNIGFTLCFDMTSHQLTALSHIKALLQMCISHCGSGDNVRYSAALQQLETHMASLQRMECSIAEAHRARVKRVPRVTVLKTLPCVLSQSLLHDVDRRAGEGDDSDKEPWMGDRESHKGECLEFDAVDSVKAESPPPSTSASQGHRHEVQSTTPSGVRRSSKYDGNGEEPGRCAGGAPDEGRAVLQLPRVQEASVSVSGDGGVAGPSAVHGWQRSVKGTSDSGGDAPGSTTSGSVRGVPRAAHGAAGSESMQPMPPSEPSSGRSRMGFHYRRERSED